MGYNTEDVADGYHERIGAQALFVRQTWPKVQEDVDLFPQTIHIVG
jgi:hypothetical protein